MILLPQFGIGYVSLREKVEPRHYNFGFGNYIDFLREPIYWNTLLRTALDVDAGDGSSLGDRVPCRLLHRQDRAAAALGPALFLLCLIPLWVSDLVRAFGWIMMLRETGIISGPTAMGRTCQRTGRAALQ